MIRLMIQAYGRITFNNKYNYKLKEKKEFHLLNLFMT